MKRKSVISLILVLAMIFSITACNSNPSGTNPNPTNTSTGNNNNPSPNEGETDTVLGNVELGNGVTKTTVDWWRAPMDVYTTADAGFQKKTPEGTLVIRINQITAADPNIYMDEIAWSYNCYEPLIQRDWDTGEIHAMLATEWGYNDDGTYHLTLRDDVTFHSGNHMTAADVLYTFQRVAKTPANKAYDAMKKVDYDNCVIEDDYHLTIAFTAPNPSFEACIATGFCSIMDSQFLEANPDYEFLDGDAGTGAYMLVETISGTQQTFKRFDEWWGGTPDYDTIIGKNYSDMTAMNIDYENGDLDISVMNVADSIERVLSGEITDTVYYDCPVNRGFALILTTVGEQTPFSDKNVRLALAHCIDMDALIYACYGNMTMARQSASFYLPGMMYYIDAGTYEYDPELSIELLAASGYGPDNPVHAVCAVGDSNPNHVAMEMIQAYASAVGIELEVHVEKTTAVTAANNATEVPSPYDLIFVPHHTYSTGDPDGNMAGRIAYNMPEGSYSATQGIDDARLAELVERGTSTLDSAEREEIYHEIQQLFYEEGWIVPLFLYGAAIFARDYVGNVKLSSGYTIYWADLTYEG